MNPNDIPTTWPVLKDAMRKRWVPPYYQRDLHQKLQNLKQGKNSVEEYYQELQTGLIRCGVIEDAEPMLARFRGGLNKEIQTILEYKEYHTITRLFHLACSAEREVQDRQASRPNFSAGRSTSWTTRARSTRTTAPPASTASMAGKETANKTPAPFSSRTGPAGSTQPYSNH